MEEDEPPECPVCLQPYDAESSVPRVLTCGHTTCEPCLKQLPNPFPNTIRCTVCTLLVKYPNSPSSLPKNLDLLHYSAVLQQRLGTRGKSVKPQPPPPENGKNQSVLFQLTLKSWPYEFYCKWKKWILPGDCILIEKLGLENDGSAGYGKVSKSFESDYAIGCVLREKESVSLVKVGVFAEGGEDSSFFKLSYESRIVSVLYGMKEVERNGLRVILNATHRLSNVGKAYGFWYHDDDNCVYMVYEKFNSMTSMSCVLKKMEDEEEKFSADEMSALGMLGMETCEILRSLHLAGLVIGFWSVSCLSFNDFGRVYVDLSEILNAGRRMNLVALKADKDLEVSLRNCLLDENLVFVCPEMLLQLLVKDGLLLDRERYRHEGGRASDVWTLGCLLVWLIVGRSFEEELKSYLHFVVNASKDGKCSDYSGFYMSWKEKIASLLEDRLGLECASVQEILCRCLGFEPGNRPDLTEVWKRLRELVAKKMPFSGILGLNQEVKRENSGHVLVLAELCQIVTKTGKETADGLQGMDENDQADVELIVDKDIAAGVSGGHFKYIEMKGHLDCVTGLAIAGGFLFSSSYDKMVNVWSLQDFKHVQSFKGHEHRVVAVVSVDGEQPICISGDNEGVICIWKASLPFSEAPIKRLYEKKDWRYSGIHAMVVSGAEYLYTGSGDKLVKAWSLQDYTLSSVMSGHKSVVSSLIVCDGVLYSGSWDGTIRLWSLSDHCPLAVLAEDKIGSISSVLCLSMEHHLLFVGHEDGTIKIWHNDLLLKSMQTHKGAVFSVSTKGRSVFSGGWDKTISVQEISEDADGVELTPIGSIGCASTITSLLYCQGKLFTGQADKIIKVYCGV